MSPLRTAATYEKRHSTEHCGPGGENQPGQCHVTQALHPHCDVARWETPASSRGAPARPELARREAVRFGRAKGPLHPATLASRTTLASHSPSPAPCEAPPRVAWEPFCSHHHRVLHSRAHSLL